MRIILCYRHVPLPRPQSLPDGIIVFTCFEDFSVGPLEDWDTPQKFKAKRSEFWQKTGMLDLPDGDVMDPLVWHQAMPHHDLLELVNSGVEFEDIPLPHQFEDVIPQAGAIEIWTDQSVSGCTFLWYLTATLEGMGVDQKNVAVCLFPDGLFGKRSQKSWSDMLLDGPDRDISPQPIRAPDWQQMTCCWNAICTLPEPVPSNLSQTSEKHILHTFDVLAKRHPSPETGLTNLQTRLLNATKRDWSKMARVIGDAMGAGWDEADTVGDAVLQFELKEMARKTPPLIEIEGTGAMRYCRVRLTEQGRAKREG